MAKFREQHVSLPLPPRAAGSWCEVRVSAACPAGGGLWWAQLQATDAARDQVVRQVFLGPCRGHARWTLLHMPVEAGALTLLYIADTPELSVVRVKRLSRLAAAGRLLLCGWRGLPVAVRGDTLGLIGRVRAALGQAPARRGETPPYSVWLQLYATTPKVAAEARPAAAGLQVAVLAGDAAAMAATLASVPQDAVIIEAPGDWSTLRQKNVLLLAAGEILAQDALARFASALAEAPSADFLCADVDVKDHSGSRRNPLFKPNPGPVFLASGLATTGGCVFRCRGAYDGLWQRLPLDAAAAKLILARHCEPSAMRRIPAILTHLPASPVARRTQPAPAAAAHAPLVSILIPSACRTRHVLRCLRTVVSATRHQAIEILLAVSRVDRSDRAQSACLTAAAALPGVKVIDLGLPAFNYAEVNNLAARHASGDALLFLNDDVAPITPDFLLRMLTYLNAPLVGAVGARLLYGNATVQHGGIVMGLAGLCEHAFRLADAADGGDHGRAAVDCEVSAVTAACMLMRASLFAELGGFDESFAVALNDVDLCLRIRSTGNRIVYAASVTLHHYESLSFGRHYAGSRAATEAIEVRRLRERWSAVIEDDPYYNPQASLEPGREWQPAFPPRPSRQWQT